MRIAVSAQTNNELESLVAQHFGSCPFFALVDIEGTEFKSITVVPNPFQQGHQPGQVPAFIKENNADVMLSGGMGGRAIQFFTQYGIQAATGAAGTVRDSIERYLGGELQGAAPCDNSVEHGH